MLSPDKMIKNDQHGNSRPAMFQMRAADNYPSHRATPQLSRRRHRGPDLNINSSARHKYCWMLVYIKSILNISLCRACVHTML
jgi:hypothetical protein